MTVLANKTESVTLRVGEQKTSTLGKIKVNFVEVLDDSRCPVGATCVWAGNAKVKITLAKGKKAAKTVELNSTLQPRVITFEGYDIQFVDLTPRPHGAMKTNVAVHPQLVVSITKHK